MKVSVAIASHERNVALRIVLRCLPPEWHATLVVSHEHERQELLDLGRPNTYVHLFPNHPVGAKWQHAVDCARKGDPDLLILTGSDDVLVADTAALYLMAQRYELIGTRTWYVYDGSAHFRLNYLAHVHGLLGAGRVFTRALLDRMGWQLFNTQRDVPVDKVAQMNAEQAGAIIAPAIPGSHLRVVSLKGPWPMYNPLEKLIAKGNVAVVPVPGMAPLADYAFEAARPATDNRQP